MPESWPHEAGAVPIYQYHSLSPPAVPQFSILTAAAELQRETEHSKAQSPAAFPASLVFHSSLKIHTAILDGSFF